MGDDGDVIRVEEADRDDGLGGCDEIEVRSEEGGSAMTTRGGKPSG